MKLFLNNPQILSEILRDIGQIFFAGIFINPLISGKIDLVIIIIGIILALTSWYLSILFNNLQKYD